MTYMMGEFANSIVLAKLKVATKGRHLWLQTIGSTLIGQGLDSVIFVLIAVVGTMPLDAIGGAILAQSIVQSVHDVIGTPTT